MENTIKDNIPHKEFAEAQERGIIKRESTFTLNGIEYYTFEKELTMICANRYLLYQQDLQSYQAFGMSMDVSRDYVAEMIEYQEKLDKAMHDGDTDLMRKHMDDLKLTTMVYKEHQMNFNVISAILELNAIAFIAACENPFVVDFEYMNKKIMAWANAIDAQEGGELLGFFYKLCSHGESNWMQLLVASMKQMAKPLGEMNENEKREATITKNILTLEIFRSSKLLKDLMQKKSSSNPVKQFRAISSYLKLKLNASTLESISNTP